MIISSLISNSVSYPTLPYIVIDQNCMRKREVLNPLLDETKEKDLRIALTDTAFLEMLKSEKWDLTMRKSLEVLAEEPERVIVCEHVGHFMRDELSRERPVENIQYEKGTDELMRILKDVKRGSNSAFEKIQRKRHSALKQVEDPRLNASRLRKVMGKMVEEIEEDFNEKDIKRLRREYQEGETGFIEDCFNKDFVKVRRKEKIIDLSKGFCEKKNIRRTKKQHTELAELLVTQPSMTACQHIFKTGMALKWLSRSGLNSMGDDKVIREWADWDYLAIAMFCHGLCSRDGDVQDMYKLLGRVANKMWC